VHDELNFNVPEAEVETLRNIVVTEMQGAMQLQIPLIAECGVGKNWLEAH
jgi:DNA polymerase-1